MKFLFVCSHQIQNLIPLFKELNKIKDINFKVIYWEKISNDHFDEEFNQTINFNIDLYDGYNFSSLSSKKSTTANFFTFFNKLKILFKLIKYLIKEDFDRILFYGYSFPHIVAAIYSKILGKKTIIRSVSYNLGKRNIFKKIIRNIYFRFANLFFDEFWSICKLNTDFYLYFGVKENKITVINSSQITFDHVYKEEDKNLFNINKFLEANNIPKNKKIIFYGGKFNIQKRPLLLLESFINANLGDDWFLLMSGGGGIYHNEVLEFIEKNVSKNIKFLGYKNLKEMINLYTLSDIVVLPSDYGETHGNVLMEAIQFECALLTSDRVGLYPEVIKHELGLVFKGDDKLELINHLKKLTTDINFLNMCKANGIKYSTNIKPNFVANIIAETLNQK